MRPWTLAICIAVALLGAAAGLDTARANEEEPLPPGTVPSSSFPPLVPGNSGDKNAVRAWCAACLDAAATSRSGVRTADLLLSAGWALEQELGETKRAAALLEEAAALYPPGEAGSGIAWLQATRLHLKQKRLDDAERTLAAARAYEGAQAPVDSPPHELQEWAILGRELAWTAPTLGVDLAEARGEFARAAQGMEALAEARERAGHTEDAPARAWSEAARFRARVGDAEKALADVSRAIEVTRGEKLLARLTLWRLYCKHGLLDDEGAPALLEAWPGDAFVEDAYAALRGLEGNPHARTTLLSLGSTAIVAGQPKAALGFYRIALNDPALLEAAREDESLWRGLLAAFPVALDLGEFDEADRILDTVTTVATVPREELDGYRLTVVRARDTAEMAKAAAREPKSVLPPERPGRPEPATRARGRLLPDTPEEPAPGAPGEETAGAPPGAGRILVPVAVIVVLLIFVLGWSRKRR